MTLQAFLIGHSLFVEDAADFVRRMAIDADRNFIGLFFPELALDNFLMDLLDQAVALTAGGRDVTAIYRRPRIGMRQDMVGRMTIGANGADD